MPMDETMVGLLEVDEYMSMNLLDQARHIVSCVSKDAEDVLMYAGRVEELIRAPHINEADVAKALMDLKNAVGLEAGVWKRPIWGKYLEVVTRQLELASGLGQKSKSASVFAEVD